MLVYRRNVCIISKHTDSFLRKIQISCRCGKVLGVKNNAAMVEKER